MKVYAEFFRIKKIPYRRKTLLHFGNSINLIGSAVLMNPGGADPLEEELDTEVIKEFFKKNHKLNSVDTDVWKSFEVSSTILLT